MNQPDPSNPSNPAFFIRVGLVLLFLSSTLFVPTALAVTPDAPGGVRAVVILSTGCTGGDSQTVEIMFPISDNDPGSYQYNVTSDSIDLGDVSLLGNYRTENSRRLFDLEFGGACSTPVITIHAWDGVEESALSCSVTVDTEVLGDYDACGTMVTDYTTETYCAPEYPSPDIGFHWTENVETPIGGNGEQELRFTKTRFGGPAFAALNLGGDGSSYQFIGDIRASSEGGTSLDIYHFSTVNQAVGSSAVGNGLTSGSFTEGISYQIEESGSTWIMTIFHHSGGNLFSLGSTTFNTDPTAGTSSFATITVTLDQWTGVASMQMEMEQYTSSLNATLGTTLGEIQSFWIEHRTPGSTGTAYSFYDRTQPLCLYTALPGQGGGVAAVTDNTGTAGGQPLEDFGGQGGAGGDPEFPGLDIQQVSTNLGMEPTFMGYLLASILIAAAGIVGFFTAQTTGAAAGAGLALIGTTVLNLTPYWFLIILLLLAVAVVVTNFSKGSNA